MKGYGESRFFNLFVGIGLTLGVWVAGLLGLFSYPNGLIYDVLLQWAPQEGKPSHVLLVLSDYQARDLDDDTWLKTINALEDLGARQVIFSFMPEKASRAFYEAVKQKSNVSFGREQLREPGPLGSPNFEAIPRQAEGLRLSVGLLGIPEAGHGIHRTERTAWLTGKGTREENVVVMAARDRLGGLPAMGWDFLINFSGRPGGIPKADLSSLLRGTLVSEVVGGKSVLIGFQVPNRFSGVLTPIDPSLPDMAPLEYHGFALDTLLSGRTIRRLGAWPSLCVIAAVVALGLLLHTLVPPRVARALVAALVLLSLMAAGMLLLYRGTWIPVTEMVVSQVLLFGVMVWQRISTRDRKVREFVLEKSARVMLGLVPGSILDSQDHWNQLVHMVSQTLPLEKTIFLEKVPGDHRVREVVALNTSLSDIAERRRDYERVPYATAIDRGVPVKVTAFFETASEEEEQFLVPLSFGGTILGFWAFTIKSAPSVDMGRLLPAIAMFSSQFAEMLYRRREWRESERVQQGWLTRTLGLEKRPDVVDRMVDLVTLLELRSALLESALESSGSACMLCDLFGRVLAINRKMQDLCGRLGVVPYQFTLLDVLVRLTGRTPTETRTIINRAIMETDILNVPVTATADDVEDSFMMTVSPLKHHLTQRGRLDERERYPFDMYGLLIELHEISERADVTRVRDRIVEQGVHRIEEGLQTIISLSAALEENSPSSASLDPILDQMRFSRSSLSAAMEELRSYVISDGFSTAIDYYPVDAAEPVTKAVAVLQNELENRRITVDVDVPPSQVLVLAMPQELTQLVEALLRILLADAYESTQITVKVVPRGLEVMYELFDSGYGIPDDDFQRYLRSPERADSGQFETIRRLRTNLDLWRAELNGSSEVGIGIRFTLRLVRSLLSA